MMKKLKVAIYQSVVQGCQTLPARLRQPTLAKERSTSSIRIVLIKEQVKHRILISNGLLLHGNVMEQIQEHLILGKFVSIS